MRTPTQAVAEARRWTSCRPGMCLWWTQEVFGAPHRYPDAAAQAAVLRLYPGTPPAGVPVFYSGGAHGHVAISMGGGRIRSTDSPANGQVGDTDLAWPTRRWGHRYIGWGRNLGGVDIPGAPTAPEAAPATPPATGSSAVVYLSRLHYGQTDSDSVRALQRALNSHRLASPGNITLPITGGYFDQTDTVVRACQAQHGASWGEGAADPPRRSSVGPRQAAHLGLTVRP